ncbi:MAG: retron-type reverse transcriptase [Akkermansiaceae bacterium]|jgi:retron-type reverse transcriptase
MTNKRQELYDRIRQSSRQQVELEEMTRLGFWKPESGEHTMPDELIQKVNKLRKELNQLNAQDRRYQNREAALIEIRKEKMAESRERQKATKERREAERQARAAAWEKRKAEEILYLGPKVSNQLNKLTSDLARLAKHALPDFKTHLALAEAMATTIGELRFLSYDRDVSKVSHYRRFLIPKKAGGTRLISAPMPRLKSAQHWLLENIISKVPLHENAHGFRPDHSILTNSAPHQQSNIVINLDLKDFFPNVTLPRVIGLYKSLGYSPSIATIFALISTEPPVQDAKLDGETWHVATSVRHLPQGAPTSPTITNLLCRRLDFRLTGIAKKHGYTYTRYADDLTFSGADREASRKILWHVRKVIEEEGFIVHPGKVRTMGRGRRQEVTGLTVNQKPAIAREDIRAYRSLLHRLETKGPDGCTWRGTSDRILAKVDGYRSYLIMVDKERHTALCQKAETLLKRHGFKQEIRHPKKSASTPPPLPREKQGSFLSKIRGFFGK